MSQKMLPSYKRLNAEAEIFGFPFMIFFALMMFTLVSLMLIYSLPMIISLLWLAVYLGVITVSSIAFKKIGIKLLLKKIELFFRNPVVIKYNQTFRIKKLDLEL